MTNTPMELRQGERFIATARIDGSYNNFDCTLANMSVAGAQIIHSQMVRIGTQANLSFRHGDLHVTVRAIVVWSHLAQTGSTFSYKTGVKLVEPSVPYAMAINSLLRAGILGRDDDSLERKRQRELEREQRRQSAPKLSIIPPSS